MLNQHGYDLEAKDRVHKTALDYAMEQDSKVMARELCRLLGCHVDLSVSLRRNSVTPALEWPDFVYDFSNDAAAFLEQAEQKRVKEVFEEKKELDHVPIDREFAGEKQYKVYYDDEKVAWDAYMTKVDLTNGPFGDFVFYKIQMIYDSNRELYIVLTRYGLIGEHGVNQRTPFNDVEEAKKEFRTIYKQKSGNEWGAEVFEPKPKKYELTQASYSTVKHQDYLAPFDYENCAKPSSLEKSVEDMIEEVTNVTMYQRAMSQMHIDNDKLPVSQLKRDVIIEARDVLGEISKQIKELDELRKVGLRADYDQMMAVFGKLASLSGRYYSLVPQKIGENEVAKPITRENVLQTEFTKLDNLVNVEFTSRILLAALYRQYEIHPIKYIYNSLGVKIVPLVEGDPECDLIRAYCVNTTDESTIKKIQIFKIERKGEPERFEKVAADIGNRKLLFHGSGATNFIGLLSQGMRIAPPEAPTTGFMFGKGCYFADMFQKSLSYSTGFQSRFLLLCDVALGNAKKLYRAEYVEKLEDKYQSVKGCGSKGPDFKNKRVVTPQGYSLPLGRPIHYEEPPEEERKKILASF